MAASIPPGMDLSKIPAAPPPPGVQSNFVDPPSLVPAIITVNLIMILWATSFVSMRLWIKRRGLGSGDCESMPNGPEPRPRTNSAIVCCVLGLILSFAYTILVLDRELDPFRSLLGITQRI
jgi:hypothetical protein